MTSQKFKITNLTCEACVKLSNFALDEIPGVTNSSVDLKTGDASIDADRDVPFDEIVAALRTVDKTAQKN